MTERESYVDLLLDVVGPKWVEKVRSQGGWDAKHAALLAQIARVEILADLERDLCNLQEALGAMMGAAGAGQS